MVGSRVMFTPKGLEVSLRVSRMARRRASGLGWVRAVNIPWNSVSWVDRSGSWGENAPSPPASETAATRGGFPTLELFVRTSAG